MAVPAASLSAATARDPSKSHPAEPSQPKNQDKQSYTVAKAVSTGLQ